MISNSKGVESRSGSPLLSTVTLSTMIWPGLMVFVKVHVTNSPGERSTAEAGLSSLQIAEVASQPAGSVSATLYVPFSEVGSRSPLLCGAASSVRLNA